jgi:hypothetical protein
MAFLNIGLTSSTAPMAAILMASNPLLVALLAGVLLDEPVRRPNPAGSGTVNGSVTGASTASICDARSARPAGLQSRCSSPGPIGLCGLPPPFGSPTNRPPSDSRAAPARQASFLEAGVIIEPRGV